MTIRFQVIPGTNLFLDLDPDEFRAIVQQFTEVAGLTLAEDDDPDAGIPPLPGPGNED